MKTYGTKRLLPVYGNSRPVERRINNIRIAGWKEQNISATPIIAQEDTYNDSAFLRIYGKSEQVVTTQGENLFDKNKAVQGVGLADKNKGYMYDTTYAYIDYLEVKPNTTYYKSGNTAGGIIAFYTLDKTYLSEISVVNGSFTTPSNVYYIRGNTRVDALNTLQIEEGSTATTYTPFVPDSPSPDYPSPINSVSNFDLISSGKNLFDLSSITTAQTMTKTDTGLKLSGYQCIGNYMWGKHLKPNTSYRISFYYIGTVTGAAGSLRMHSSSKNNTIQIGKASASNTWVSATFTTPSDISLYNQIWAYGSGEMSYIQIEQNTGSRTDYEGHKSKTINFPYTLRSLPDGTKDYIEIDNVNKTAKLYRNVREYIFNGNEDWSFYSGIFGRLYTSFITDALYTTAISCYSNRYLGKVSGGGNTYTDPNNMWLQNTSLYPRLYINDFVNGGNTYNFKIWLGSQYNAGTPVTVQYKLAIPTVEDLDYEEVKTYYPYTQIYTNATIQPTLEGTVRVIDR